MPLLGRRRVGEGTPAYALRDRPALCSRILRDSEGQAVAKFSLVIFILILVLFSILEVGLLLNDKMVLMSTAREVARICAVEEGKTQNALDRLRELLIADGIDPDIVTASIRPTQAIYGTTIYVDLSYDYPVKSPVVRPLSGPYIPISAHAATRSEFVPR